MAVREVVAQLPRRSLGMVDLIRFRSAFEALTEHAPFPWQEAIYERTDLTSS